MDSKYCKATVSNNCSSIILMKDSIKSICRKYLKRKDLNTKHKTLSINIVRSTSRTILASLSWLTTIISVYSTCWTSGVRWLLLIKGRSSPNCGTITRRMTSSRLKISIYLLPCSCSDTVLKISSTMWLAFVTKTKTCFVKRSNKPWNNQHWLTWHQCSHNPQSKETSKLKTIVCVSSCQ